MILRHPGQTVHSQARAMVKRILEKCEEEAGKAKLLHPLHTPITRFAEYTSLLTTTIRRTRTESLTSEEETLSTPGKKRPRSLRKKFYCSFEDQAIIRNIINDFYIEKKIVPTALKLLAAIRDEIDFPWSVQTLRNLLRNMGFTWKKVVVLEESW